MFIGLCLQYWSLFLCRQIFCLWAQTLNEQYVSPGVHGLFCAPELEKLRLQLVFQVFQSNVADSRGGFTNYMQKSVA